MVRPPMDLELSLELHRQLTELAAEAEALLTMRCPRGVGEMYFEELLGLLHVRARVGGPSRMESPLWEEADTGWLFIAAAGAATHGEWAGPSTGESMCRSASLATERLAQGVVPAHPERFDMAYALEFIRNAAMEVAMVRLGLALRPNDRYSISAQPAAQQQLIEVSSTGLIGAWVARRLIV
jgi:hypothetical protein